MAIPALPPSLMHTGQAPKRLAAGQVPPTPTRLTLARHSATHLGTAAGTGRSPSAASVPIATTLVPPTPASLHHPGYTGEKSAFLAPFEMFYDALSDAKELKKWLGEQLHKSNTLVATLQRQQEQMEETVSGIVDKKVAGLREEVYGLRVRVTELEQALHARSSSSGAAYSLSPGMGAAKLKGKANGHVFDSYTFPPVDPTSTPNTRRQDDMSAPNSQTSSPAQVPFDVGKRLSVSAMRLDPPAAQPQPPSSRTSFRERDHAYASATGSASGWSQQSQTGLPTSSTRSSLNHSHSVSQGHRHAPPNSRYAPAERDKHPHPHRDEVETGRNASSSASQRRNSIAAPPTRRDRERAESPMEDDDDA